MRIPLAHASLCGFYMHCLFHLDNSEVDFIICIRSKQSQKQKSTIGFENQMHIGY